MKVYQNIPGVTPENENRKDSKFWNEGKFNNFIAPHLPEDCSDMTFVEMGTNAGLFLKMSIDKGFRNAVGIEKDKTPVAEGLRYRDEIGYDYNILRRTLGGQFGENGSFDFDEIPVADYTVMSTFHYYIDINSWLKYLDRLKYKTRYVIIVSRHVTNRHWKALSDLEDVRGYFSDWEEVKYIPPIEVGNDPSPRNLWSVCFKSKLQRISVDDIKTEPDNSMYDAVRDLAATVTDDIDPYSTEYYKRWVERKKGRWAGEKIKKFVRDKTNMLNDIKKNGLRDPLIVQKDLKLSDGGHRLAILSAIGYKNVIARFSSPK